MSACVSCLLPDSLRIADEDWDVCAMCRLNGKDNPKLDYEELNSTLDHLPTHSNAQRTLITAFTLISDLGSQLDLSQITTENAQRLFLLCRQRGLLRGRNVKSVVGAILFRAAKEAGEPLILKYLAGLLGICVKEISRCNKMIVKRIPERGSPSLYSAQILAERYADALCMGEEGKKAASQIAKKAIDMGIVTGKTPSTVASAVVFMAAGLVENGAISIEEIVECSHLRKDTVKRCYKDLYVRKSELCEGFDGELYLPSVQIK